MKTEDRRVIHRRESSLSENALLMQARQFGGENLRKLIGRALTIANLRPPADERSAQDYEAIAEPLDLKPAKASRQKQ